MKIQKFHVYIADLNPRRGTEPRKVRPVVVVQTDLLNGIHPSTVVCPLTTRVVKRMSILRVSLSRNESGLKQGSDILVDQIRAIDNRRFIKQMGRLTKRNSKRLLDNLQVLILE